MGRFFEAVERAFEAYWENPGWKTVFLDQTVRGQLAVARTWDDFLAWAEDYRPRLEHAEDLGGDRVHVVVGLRGRSKAGGGVMAAHFYDIITLRDGVITRVEEYTSREAMEAAQKPA